MRRLVRLGDLEADVEDQVAARGASSLPATRASVIMSTLRPTLKGALVPVVEKVRTNEDKEGKTGLVVRRPQDILEKVEEGSTAPGRSLGPPGTVRPSRWR